MTEQRRLAAIVSADVAGYSRLMGRDESGTLAALKALRQEVVDPGHRRAMAAASSRPPATGCCWSSRASSMPCAARSRCRRRWRTASPTLPRIGASPSASASTSATSSSRATTSSATASTSPRGFRRSRRREEFAYRAACMTTCATGSTSSFEDGGDADTQEHRSAGPGLALAAQDSGSAERQLRRIDSAPAARQAVDRRAAVPEHERRSRAGVFR